VIAHAFDDRRRAAVANTKSFRRPPAEKSLAAGRAVKADVADENIFVGNVCLYGAKVETLGG
jgi:hypothetical protein